MAALCKRCDLPIVWELDPDTRRWQEQVQDYHSTPDECINLLSTIHKRLEERVTKLEQQVIIVSNRLTTLLA